MNLYGNLFSEDKSMNTHRTIICLLVTLLAAVTAANAEDPVNIQDPALKAAVEAALGIPDPTPTHMLGLTWLDASNRGVSDLTGLEHARNLALLNLSSSLITDIQPLRNLISLTNLDLANNRIADIEPLVGLTGLTELGLRNNLVVDIGPLSSLTNLVLLDLHSDGPTNQIRDISALANMANMRDLYLAGNPIQDMNVLANLTGLGVLDLDRTGVADITPLAGLTSLWRLFLNLNQVSDLSPLEGLTNLVHLSLEGNQITDVSPLAALNGLTYLNLASNQIPDISPLAGLTALEHLELQGNQIDDCRPVAGLTRLTFLHLGWNRISDLSCLSGLTNLEVLFLFDNRIIDVAPLSSLTNLLGLNCDWNQIVDVSALSTLTALTSLTLNSNRVSDITALATLTSVQHLDLDNNLVEDISSLAGLASLTSLNLGRNAIVDISALTGMTDLSELWLSGNPLHPKACVVDIPLIRANNPGIVIHYDGCVDLPQTLTVSSTVGGSVVMPGEGVLMYPWGDLAPVEAVADEGYQFTHWRGTAVDPNVMLDPCAPHTSVFMDADYSLVAHFKPRDEPWRTVYFNDFEDHVGPEWSHNLVDATPIGARRFLGQFGNDMVTLTLADLPAHSEVRVSFDVFTIRSWDGYLHPDSPDLWSLEVRGGERLIRTTFDNHHELDLNRPPHRQSYPEEFDTGDFAPQTGAAERNSLGYEFVWQVPTVADAVYCLKFVFPHLDGVLQFDFHASGLEELWNESWGLDSVRVEVLVPAEPEVTLTASSAAGGSVAVPGEGTFLFGQGESVAIEAVAEAGYHFTHWSGSAVDAGKVADPMSASTTVVVDGDCTLVANFAVDQKTLTISSTAGGSVTLPGEGTFEYPLGSPVAVVAAAEAHYHFTHWSGSAVDAGKVADPTSASTSVTVDTDYTLVANFRIDQYRLIVSEGTGGFTHVNARAGDVILAWDGDFTATLDHGTEVTLTATAYAGWKFISWSGTIGTDESPFTFQLTQDCYLEAIWEPEP
ncbi:MAG: hypothetical protein A2Y77_15990 [Planctomycetes bacterium RBG_13_62_9]|nr:MAG: hypothetical protein A2Y77_15990 [Planctomycetes bacterium RBG_13_62_9]